MVQFSYSVQWTPLPHIPPSQALELQLKSTMPHGHSNMDIHWLAIINSFVLMLLILCLTTSISIEIGLKIDTPCHNMSQGSNTACRMHAECMQVLVPPHHHQSRPIRPLESKSVHAVVSKDLSRYLQIPDEELNAVEEETGASLS